NFATRTKNVACFRERDRSSNPSPSSGESCKPSVPQLRSRRSVRSGIRLQNSGERNGDAVHMLWVPARALREKYRLVGSPGRPVALSEGLALRRSRPASSRSATLLYGGVLKIAAARNQ